MPWIVIDVGHGLRLISIQLVITVCHDSQIGSSIVHLVLIDVVNYVACPYWVANNQIMYSAYLTETLCLGISTLVLMPHICFDEPYIFWINKQAQLSSTLTPLTRAWHV